jgi:hypothetical protein
MALTYDCYCCCRGCCASVRSQRRTGRMRSPPRARQLRRRLRPACGTGADLTTRRFLSARTRTTAGSSTPFAMACVQASRCRAACAACCAHPVCERSDTPTRRMRVLPSRAAACVCVHAISCGVRDGSYPHPHLDLQATAQLEACSTSLLVIWDAGVDGAISSSVATSLLTPLTKRCGFPSVFLRSSRACLGKELRQHVDAAAAHQPTVVSLPR